MLTLYKSLIRSHLEYCCPLWHPDKIQDIQKLEGIQRTFTKKIVGLSNMNYWERLASLKLMSLQRRCERYLIIQMWKLLHKNPPNNVNVKFRERTRLGWKAVVPSWENHSRAANRNLYENSFAVVGPQLWNTLPVALNTIQTKDTFKYRLTDYLSKLPDEPPVRNYARAHKNTLHEVLRRSPVEARLRRGGPVEGIT